MKIEANGTTWTVTKGNVDVETGRILSTKEAKQNYIKIITKKYVRKTGTITGTIEYITEYRRNPQGTLDYKEESGGNSIHKSRRRNR